MAVVYGKGTATTCKLLSSAVTTLTLSLECVASCVVARCLSALPMDYPESNGCVFLGATGINKRTLSL